MKKRVCIKCKQEKPIGSFRHYVTCYGRPCICRTCIHCEEGKKDAKREYNRFRQQQWRKANPDGLRRQQDKLKANPEYNERRRQQHRTDHYKENVAKPRDRKFRDGLKDGYVLKCLSSETGLPPQEIKKMDGAEILIETKRQLLKLKRIVKTKNKDNGKD